jgi:hypothetical protein
LVLKVGRGRNNVSEGDVWVGKLCAQESVHDGVVTEDSARAQKCVQRVEVGGVDTAQRLLGSEQHIHYDVSWSVRFHALVHGREDVHVPNDSPVEPGTTHALGGREEASI